MPVWVEGQDGVMPHWVSYMKDRNRQRTIEKCRERQRNTETYRDLEKDTLKYRDREIEKDKYREVYGYTERKRNMKKNRHVERQTEK